MTSQAQADSAADQADSEADLSGPTGAAAEPRRDGLCPAACRRAPAWTLTESQLADLELLLSGAFAPLAGFMTRPTSPPSSTRGSWPTARHSPSR